jgi:hypothetical protein
MKSASEAAAWQALLPADSAWLRPRSRLDGHGLRQQLSELPDGSVAVALGRGGPLGPAHLLRRAGCRCVHSYVALPTWRQPVIVADRDPDLLRYVSYSLLTVPPGVGPLASLVCTVGLRLVRLRGLWTAACSILPGRVWVGRLA